MRRPDPTEEALNALSALRKAGDHADTLRQLPAYLKSKSSAVVARAAELAGSTRDIGLAPALVEAFRRVFPNAAKRDPGCRAITQITRALLQMDASAAEVYSLGIRYQQWEASFGPRVDTADELRAACALGLVAMGDPDALLSCCELLSDHAPIARAGAVRAMGISGRADAELLLRFKARLGDGKTEVLAETFTALLRLGPRERSVPFVAAFLSEPADELAEAAAIALGESRFEQVVPLLLVAFEQGGTLARIGAILLALALSRSEEGARFCFTQFQSGTAGTAGQALEALAVYKNDSAWRKEIRAALDHARNAKWEAIWQYSWLSEAG